ncbi:MAG TPA: serine hydrolase domain-containing protein [Blastocatellia bacterium]|nr:serine hydrolase domain-containing protein [Blastocatellia bacterium]
MRSHLTVRPTSVCRSLIRRQGSVYHIFVALVLVITFATPGLAAASKLSRNSIATVSDSADLSALCERLKTKLNESHQAASFPGATIGFVLPDGRSGSVSVGLADVEQKTALRPSDRMLAGSIGKTYVSAVMLQLVEEGKINLDTKIERWFAGDPWFPRLPNAKDITLRMLMNHSSGIPEHVLNKNFIAAMRKDPDRIWKPEELLTYILDAKPLFAAGKGWSYADTNYILVGMIFERSTKKTVYGEVERRILRPFKLERTVPSDRRILPDVITGYSMPNSPFGFEGRVIVDGKFIINPQMEWTGGGFASTAEDLARWAKLLYEGKVLKNVTLAQMLEGVTANEGRGSGAGNKYGLAVQIRPSEFGVSYGHGGWFPGYISEMEYFPQHKVAVAIQFNTDAQRTLKKGMRAYIADAMRIILDDSWKTRRASMIRRRGAGISEIRGIGYSAIERRGQRLCG